MEEETRPGAEHRVGPGAERGAGHAIASFMDAIYGYTRAIYREATAARKAPIVAV